MTHIYGCRLFKMIWLFFWLLFVRCSYAEEIKSNPTSINEEQQIPTTTEYSYGYKVINTPEGDQHGHQVTINGQNTRRGNYYVKFADGSDQDVQYYADSRGYQPQVRYITQNINYQSNADLLQPDIATKIAVYTNAPVREKSTVTKVSDSTEVTVKHNNNNNNNTAYEEEEEKEETLQSVDTTRSPPTSTGTTTEIYYYATEHPQSEHRKIPYDETVAKVVNNDEQQFETRIMFLNDAEIEKLIKNADKVPIPGAEFKKLNLTDILQKHDDNSSPSSSSSEDFYNPETNEISNSFLKKIVSVIPELYATEKHHHHHHHHPKVFSRPIVVTSGNFSLAEEEVVNVAAMEAVSVGEQQSASDIVQQQIRHPTANEKEEQPESQQLEQKKSGQSQNYNNKEDASEKVEEELKTNYQQQQPAEIEPQFVQEQAVYTTTVEIQKSLPFNMDFIRESDNRLTNEDYDANNNNININKSPRHAYPFVNPQFVRMAASSQAADNIFVNPVAPPPISSFATRTVNLLFPSPTHQPAVAPIRQIAPKFFNNAQQTSIPFSYIPVPLKFATPSASSEDDYLLRDAHKIPPVTVDSNSVRNAQPADNAEYDHQPDERNQLNLAASSINRRPNGIIEANADSTSSDIIPSQPNRPLDIQPHIMPNLLSDITRPHHPNHRLVYDATGYRDGLFPTYYTIDFPPSTNLYPFIKQFPLALHSYTTAITQQHQQQQQQQQQQQPVPAKLFSPSQPLFTKSALPSSGSGSQTYGSNGKKRSSVPFRPSHPTWDSIYPPQHMYHVPFVAHGVGRGAERQSRNLKDVASAASRRSNNHQRLRHLLIEYGGFKPPMIPSTLLSNTDELPL